MVGQLPFQHSAARGLQLVFEDLFHSPVRNNEMNDVFTSQYVRPSLGFASSSTLPVREINFFDTMLVPLSCDRNAGLVPSRSVHLLRFVPSALFFTALAVYSFSNPVVYFNYSRP